MVKNYLIKDVIIVNEYAQFPASVYIENGFIKHILPQDSPLEDYETQAEVIQGHRRFLLPGIIDDQVHFREPGLTHKGDIQTESKAAVAGGITSYMEMPNTQPPAITNQLLEEKFRRADGRSWANYSFYLGATNDNIEAIRDQDIKNSCGLKVFMGSSTGNMLVDDPQSLERIFHQTKTLLAAHCEDQATINANLHKAIEQYGKEIPFRMHPHIRSEEACYLSSSKAIALAEKYGTRLHVLHLSTAKELKLLSHHQQAGEKNITAEVCVHHLWFNNTDYADKGSLIKWNPAIKTEPDRIALLQAVLDDRIDIIATDHAPHTLAEKQNSYLNAPSGGPLVQHALQMMLELYQRGLISLEKIVSKMAHNPAKIFNIERRGYIKEGYWADLVLIDLNKTTEVTKDSLHYKCGWSPLEGHTFKSAITHTFVNGKPVVRDGKIAGEPAGMRLKFRSPTL